MLALGQEKAPRASIAVSVSGYLAKGITPARAQRFCASTLSASTKVELRSVLNYSNGRVSGTWEERNFNQSGTITGRVTDSEMKLSIDGDALNGILKMTFGESSQSVSISTNGSVLRGMNIDFARTS